MILSGEKLEAIGVAVYGANWQSPLAHVLGVTRQTIHRWRAGENAIPPAVKLKLFKVVEDRMAELGSYWEELGQDVNM